MCFVTEIYLESVDGPNPSGWCRCGCGNRTHAADKTDRSRGIVKDTPRSYLPGHVTRKSPHEYIEDPKTGCWVWQRSTDRKGYGGLRIAGRLWKAHRYYYTKYVGEIPSGMQLDHLCRNPSCVNPAHLEPVTSAENGLRGINTKLTYDDVCAIRELYDADPNPPTFRDTGRAFGVCGQTIADVVHRKVWVAA